MPRSWARSIALARIGRLPSASDSFPAPSQALAGSVPHSQTHAPQTMLAAKRLGPAFLTNSLRPSSSKIIARSVGMLADPSAKYKSVGPLPRHSARAEPLPPLPLCCSQAVPEREPAGPDLARQAHHEGSQVG